MRVTSTSAPHLTCEQAKQVKDFDERLIRRMFGHRSVLEYYRSFAHLLA